MNKFMRKNRSVKLHHICILLFFAVFFTSYSFSQSSDQNEQKYEWEKIILLETKESQVKELFGKPFLENGSVKAYRMGFGNLLVSYGNLENVSKTKCNLNITPDTVISYNIILSNGISLANFKYNSADFEKETGHDGSFNYSSSQSNISFTSRPLAEEKEFILYIYYFPSIKFLEKKCNKK